MTKTKTDRFREFVEKESLVASEKGVMEDWQLYEHLKKKMKKDFDINHEIGIKIITEVAGL